jgi:hypothetical protein
MCSGPPNPLTTSRRSPQHRSRPASPSPPRPSGAKSSGSGPSGPLSRILTSSTRSVKLVNSDAPLGRRCSVGAPVRRSDSSCRRCCRAAMGAALWWTSRGVLWQVKEVRAVSCSRPGMEVRRGAFEICSSCWCEAVGGWVWGPLMRCVLLSLHIAKARPASGGQNPMLLSNKQPT